MIDSPVFAMDLGHEDERSWIEIGGYTENENMVWIEMLGSPYHWTVPMLRVTLDGIEHEMEAQEATLDSGTSLTYVPVNDYNTILD